MFTLFLRAADGSERCYYQTGTGATDVITGVFAAEGDDPLYPDVTVVGYTDGSLAGTNGESKTVDIPRGLMTSSVV